MVLNSSFNENEPVVCEPKEALDCFLRTRMDVLIMGETILFRHNGEAGEQLEQFIDLTNEPIS
jgi:carbamoyltransferase